MRKENRELAVAIVNWLNPVVMNDGLWNTPQLKKTQDRLKRRVFRQAIKLIEVLRTTLT